MMLRLGELAQFLNQFFAIQRFEHDPGGIYHFSERPIRRLGLALDPCPELADWAIANQLDALFLHRPWQLELAQFPSEIGVVSYHLAFDEGLTLGFNPRLATVLGLVELETLGTKAERPIGMLGNVSKQQVADYCHTLGEVFDGYDQALVSEPAEVTRVAVVGAMSDALVREAAERGANFYITGQFRQPAKLAVQETGIAVVAVGHWRSEAWGLRALAGIVQERWAKLEVVLPPEQEILA